MARYIDVDNIKFDISGLVKIEPNDYKEIAFYFFKQLDEMPIADVRENVRGEWIHDGYDFSHGNDWIHCSVCGKRGINVPNDLTKFCPNCGADMREGKQ